MAATSIADDKSPKLLEVVERAQTRASDGSSQLSLTGVEAIDMSRLRRNTRRSRDASQGTSTTSA
jgi:hypothetical protein